jgi:hypothetical protein
MLRSNLSTKNSTLLNYEWQLSEVDNFLISEELSISREGIKINAYALANTVEAPGAFKQFRPQKCSNNMKNTCE